MKNPLPLAAALVALGVLGAPAAQAAASVSVEIAQPGVYGRIVLGNLGVRPAVVYPEPVIVAPAPYARVRSPIYLYVPPAHQRNWSRYCGLYEACGQPVYFVQENWVRAHRAAPVRPRPVAAPPVRPPHARPGQHAQPHRPQARPTPSRPAPQAPGRPGGRQDGHRR